MFWLARTLANYSFKADLVDVKVSSISSGQLKKLDLAILLAKNPDLLLLDEPTNHLDIYTKEELELFILEQELPMIIVSHDQYFISKIKVNQVVELN